MKNLFRAATLAVVATVFLGFSMSSVATSMEHRNDTDSSRHAATMQDAKGTDLRSPADAPTNNSCGNSALRHSERVHVRGARIR